MVKYMESKRRLNEAHIYSYSGKFIDDTHFQAPDGTLYDLKTSKLGSATGGNDKNNSSQSDNQNQSQSDGQNSSQSDGQNKSQDDNQNQSQSENKNKSQSDGQNSSQSDGQNSSQDDNQSQSQNDKQNQSSANQKITPSKFAQFYDVKTGKKYKWENNHFVEVE